MVVAEVALALVLLVGAGLLIQTFFKLREQYASLRSESVLTLRTVLPDKKYGDLSQRTNFYKEVLARVQSLPGDVSAGYAPSIPSAWPAGPPTFIPDGRMLGRLSVGGFTEKA